MRIKYQQVGNGHAHASHVSLYRSWRRVIDQSRNTAGAVNRVPLKIGEARVLEKDQPQRIDAIRLHQKIKFGRTRTVIIVRGFEDAQSQRSARAGEVRAGGEFETIVAAHTKSVQAGGQLEV